MEASEKPKAGGEDGSKPVSAPPAYFVILRNPQGEDTKEEGILVANQDLSSVAPAVVLPGPDKPNVFHSANCTSADITVTLDNNNMWNEFYTCSTEMVLTKQGRRMFPYCRYWISGLVPCNKYILVMDIAPLDTHRCKWNGKWWEPGGKAEPHVLGRVFIHPESPSTGQYWMHQPVSFYKLKLTNNVLDDEGHIILHSMHRYLPRLHVVPADKCTEVIQLNGPNVHTFTFPQTEFIAVTAYQNFQITQLKIDCNPFAKGFREGAISGKSPKELKPKNFEKDTDSPSNKNLLDYDDPESIRKLREIFRMSEHSDGDTENEAFTAERDLPRIMNPQSRLQEITPLKTDNNPIPDSTEDSCSMASLSVPAEKPNVVVKEEPEDNYDYSKTMIDPGLELKHEKSDDDVTDEYGNNDEDFPILEKHFAQFKTEPCLSRKRSLSSPSGVAKAKLLHLDNGEMPVLYLEQCSTDKNTENVCSSPEPSSAASILKRVGILNVPPLLERVHNSESPNIVSHIGEAPAKNEEKRIRRSKVNADFVTLKTVISTSRGPKRKLPFLLPKSPVTPTHGSVSTVVPVVKRRGRPPKNKGAKVGRPAKKTCPIAAPGMFPDFNPDLEDVDGVLFVAFSSKEALDVHTGDKPKDAVTTSPPPQPASAEEKGDAQRLAVLQRQLVADLGTMRYRQVIHPALQQVGLKLNIVDRTMSIDLRYLGVQLPLPHITSNSQWDNYGVCAQASGFPFVSRTGKTTDYTKIKGWRHKFSTNSESASSRNEANISETSLKNLSAFCSDELDEYLENEAKLMEDIKGLSQNDPLPSVSYQLPTKSASYVRTLDSVLKKQVPPTSSSAKSSIPLALPATKRKYTRRASTPKAKSKPIPILPYPVTMAVNSNKTVTQKNIAPHSKQRSKSAPVHSAENPATPRSPEKLPETSRCATVQTRLTSPLESSLAPRLPQTLLQSSSTTPKPAGVSKAHSRLLELEKCAVSKGIPRTLITKERAAVALSTLLTAQTSLKNKPIHKMINKPTTSCNNEFCRLGCVCPSLSHPRRNPTHCHRLSCMFRCVCLKSKSHLTLDPSLPTSARTTKDIEDATSPFYEDQQQTPEHGGTHLSTGQINGAQQEEMSDKHSSSSKEPSEMAENQSKSGAVETRERKSTDCCESDKEFKDDSSVNSSRPAYVPIWDRLDIEHDPEPICIPEQAELVDTNYLQHKGNSEKSKSSGGCKSAQLSAASPPIHPEDRDPVYLHFDNMMTCARVRGYEHKTLEEKEKKDQCTHVESVTAVEEHTHDLNTHGDQNEEDTKDLSYKKCKESESSAPTSLFEISGCSWEQDPDSSQSRNVVSETSNKRQPQLLRMGNFNIELTLDNKAADTSTSAAKSSRVKISMASCEKKEKSFVKCQIENVEPLEENPLDKPENKDAKCHGGKGLPFYTKLIPAGKLVAQLKSSSISQAELIQVNGKGYPHAKLLLGQMGALHPANRLAAYITHRLRPSLFHLSKLNELGTKVASKTSVLEPSEGDTSAKDTVCVEQTISSSPQNKTAATPSLGLSPLVMGEVGGLQQKSPEVRSPEPITLGSCKISTQSSPAPLAPSKHIPVVCSSPSLNTTSITTPPLSSAGLGTVSPSRNQDVSSAPKLMTVVKLVTKDSSVSIPTGSVATPAFSTDTIRTMALPSAPPKETVVPNPPIQLPVLIRAPTIKTASSAVPLSLNSTTNKSIATSLAASLVSSTNLPTLGSVIPHAGPSTAPTLIAVSPQSAPKAVTSEFEKRMGPRLLLIPVPNSSSPVRHVQTLQTSPGQKMVLQPIRNANGVNLFRHPNGQIIQLVPLQQVKAASIQPSRQQIILRNPGSTLGIRLSLPRKTEAVTPSDIVIIKSIPADSSGPPIVSISNTSPIKSGFAIVPPSSSLVSQLSTQTAKTTTPTACSEVSTAAPKVTAYTSSGHSIITSSGIPPKSEGFSLLKLPPAAPGSILRSADLNANITQMTDVAMKDTNEEDKLPGKSLESQVLPALREDTLSIQGSAESKDEPDSEIMKPDCKDEMQDHSKDSVESSELKSVSHYEDEDSGKSQDEKKSRASKDGADKKLGTESPSDTVSQSTSDKTCPMLVPIETVNSTAISGQSPADTKIISPTCRRTDSPVGEKNRSPERSKKVCCPEPDITVFSSCEHNSLNETGEKATKLYTLKQSRNAKHVFLSTVNMENEPCSEESTCLDTLDRDKDTTDCNSHSDNESDVCESVDVETVEELSENINLTCINASVPSSSDSICDASAKLLKGPKKGLKVKLEERTCLDTLDKDKDTTDCNSHSDNESEVCESVDVETVEELSENINLTCINASFPSSSDSICDASAKILKGPKKGLKVNGDDPYLATDGERSYFVHRKNHTANERKRRNEMRDLFEELKNALGLHNLPKVSKSYILKQAIEEIEGLTDVADTLIRQKAFLTQKQSHLIKRVSNLSGKPKEVVLKKLEYIYTKQKVIELERQKKNIEEDLALLKASRNNTPPARKPLSLFKLEEDSNEASSSKTKKPIILSRKPVLLPIEPNSSQQGIATPSSLMPSTGSVMTLDKAQVTGQDTGIPPTIFQADLSPAQAQSEKDDLSMMPKIVNVTSLACESSSELGREMCVSCPTTGKVEETRAYPCYATDLLASDAASVQPASSKTTLSVLPSASVLVKPAEESLDSLLTETRSSDTSLMESVRLGALSSCNNEITSNCDLVAGSDSPFGTIPEAVNNGGLELELKKLSSAIDHSALDPNELLGVMADQEDTDETLTSLLNEIAFLNQELSHDTDDLDSVSDFAGSDSASRGSASKYTDVDTSFPFGRFRDMSEAKEKNISLSPLFLQLEEGEVQETIKLGEEVGIVDFQDTMKDTLPNVGEKQCRSQKPFATLTPSQRSDKPEASGSDVLWRPMPKLAPLGLKSSTPPRDQRVLGNKSMPSLASIVLQFKSPKSSD